MAAVQFSDDGARAMQQKKLSVSGAAVRSVSTPFSVFYELDRTAEFIASGGFARVALQFPDSLLPDAPEVLWSIEARLRKAEQKCMLFVSGDSSYASCCVDEISAQHLEAAAIVHYGRACLSPTAASIPVLYIFGRQEIDAADCAAAVQQVIAESSSSSPESCSEVVLLYDAVYSHAIPDILAAAAAAAATAAVIHAGVIYYASDSTAEAAVAALSVPAVTTKTEEQSVSVGGLLVPGVTDEQLLRCAVLYIGAESRQLSNMLMRCAQCAGGRFSYDPQRPDSAPKLRTESAGANRDLMRRFHQIQRVKEAGVIGIVAAGVGVRGGREMLSQLRTAAESCGRKVYTFAVGRVNVAKLSNFAEVEAFCLVACAESSLLDARDFHVPIVTPLELQIALGLREWTGFYSTELADLQLHTTVAAEQQQSQQQQQQQQQRGALQHIAVVAEPDDAANSNDDSDAPYFSLISGGYRSRPNVLPVAARAITAAAADSSGTSIGDSSSGVLSKFVSPAAEFLKAKEYQGLSRRIGETEVHAAVQGATGIASDYSGV
jgi:diphthamide biosynthesis protein 2